MRKSANKTVSLFFTMTVVGVALVQICKSQGRVILNEIGEREQVCTGGSQFIELYNLGPGIQNISCYKLVTNNYTITIPNDSKAILNPGETYLIAGADKLLNCGSVPVADVDLNWKKCIDCISNGTTMPLSSRPDSNAFLFTSANNLKYPIALYNTNFNVIDAIRTPGNSFETGQPRSSPNPGGNCTSQTITLSTILGDYEEPQSNTGSNSTYARGLNGSCTWNKDPANATPGASNNTSTFNSQITLSTSNSTTCTQSINITIDGTLSTSGTFTDYNWVLSKSPYDNIYSSSQTPISYPPNSFSISTLATGSYNLLLTPNIGCSDAFLSFSISCPYVPIKLINFSAASTLNNNKFEIIIDADAELDQLFLESSSDAKLFSKLANIPFENRKGDQKISFEIPSSTDEFFRLVMIDIFGKRLVSEVIKIKNKDQDIGIRVFPNPFQDYISLQLFSINEDILIACLLSTNGAIIKEENFKLLQGLNNFRMNTLGISKGSYLLSLKKTSSPNIQFSNIVKQ